MKINKIVGVILFLFLLEVKSNDVLKIIESGTNLELVHVVFRHGDRTPERLYANDPYTAEDFHPVGLGHLTNSGKNTAYRLGKELRSTYNKFLGSIFTPEIIEAISSHSGRCITSLQLVLAGLFPPTGDQIWNSSILWQPIAFHSFPSHQNKLFAPFNACPGYISRVSKALDGIYQDPNVTRHSEHFPYIQEKSGIKSNPGYVIDLLYSTLKSEQEWGLTLPSWTQSVWPEPLTELQGHVFKYLALNDDLKTIAAGYLTSKIVNNTLLTINNSSSAKGRKIYLYSGHDTNIIALLMMMEIFTPHCPPYGSYITFELHNVQGTRFLKILYQNYTKKEPITVTIPKCGVYCSFENFVEIYSKYINTVTADHLCES